MNRIEPLPTFHCGCMPCLQRLPLFADKPSPPRNLIIAGMTADSGDLEWEVPKDDGNSPITGYIIEKKDVSRRSWQEACQATELTATVTKLHEGKMYLFRVSAENEFGVSEPVEIAEPVMARNPFSEFVVDGGCSVVVRFSLKWNSS